jgi:hypothetical protein
VKYKDEEGKRRRVMQGIDMYQQKHLAEAPNGAPTVICDKEDRNRWAAHPAIMLVLLNY